MDKAFSSPADRMQRFFTRVPEITVFFWIVKLLTTAMGEAFSDYLVFQINPFIAVGLGAIGLAASLILQFSVRRYVAWIYWLVVVMVAIFGTMVADATHIALGVPYLASTIFFVIVLTVVLVVWYECNLRLLVCLYHDSSTRCLVCGLGISGSSRWRSWVGEGSSCHLFDVFDCCLCGVPDNHAQ
jgi:uncharacterized membrane-anchored protein